MKVTLSQLKTLATKLPDEQKAKFLSPFLHNPPKKLALAYAKELTKGLTEDELYELLTFLQEQYNDKEGWEYFVKWRQKKKRK
jgi:hypothetical protein